MYEEYKDRVEERGMKVHALVLAGSQAFGYARQESDHDLFAIVDKKIEQIFFKYHDVTITLFTTEQIEEIVNNPEGNTFAFFYLYASFIWSKHIIFRDDHIKKPYQLLQDNIDKLPAAALRLATRTKGRDEGRIVSIRRLHAALVGLHFVKTGELEYNIKKLCKLYGVSPKSYDYEWYFDTKVVADEMARKLGEALQPEADQ